MADRNIKGRAIGWLLRDGPGRRHHERVPGLIAVAGRRRVLDEPDVIHQNVARDRARGILIAGILVVHPERHACVDGHVREDDLVSIRRNGLQWDSGKIAPAWMNVGRADAVDARLSRGWKIGSPNG